MKKALVYTPVQQFFFKLLQFISVNKPGKGYGRDQTAIYTRSY